MERYESGRREALALVASVAAASGIAGCLSGDDRDSSSNAGTADHGDDFGEDSADSHDDTADDPGSGDGADDAHDDGDGGTADTGGTEGRTDDAGSTATAWNDVDEIVLSATTAGFEGVEPDPIAGVENPELVLTAGDEYALTWKNADGQAHNIEIRDDDGAVVSEYRSELMDERGGTQTLEFEATPAMAIYTCEVHYSWGKYGDIVIRE